MLRSPPLALCSEKEQTVRDYFKYFIYKHTLRCNFRFEWKLSIIPSNDAGMALTNHFRLDRISSRFLSWKFSWYFAFYATFLRAFNTIFAAFASRELTLHIKDRLLYAWRPFLSTYIKHENNDVAPSDSVLCTAGVFRATLFENRSEEQDASVIGRMGILFCFVYRYFATADAYTIHISTHFHSFCSKNYKFKIFYKFLLSF